MNNTLTQGNVQKGIVKFSLPLLMGAMVQQLYNVADSIIVGRFLGADALAAVGSSFTIMVFLTSIMLGLCMGASVYLAQLYGAGDEKKFQNTAVTSLVFIGLVSLIINALVLIFTDGILHLLNIPAQVFVETKEYIRIIFYGFMGVFVYNYFTSLLRSTGNSLVPFIILAISAALNVLLDILFITTFQMGVAGAAWATIIAQGISALGCGMYCYRKMPQIFKNIKKVKIEKDIVKTIGSLSILSSIQQSIMNLGILMIQGLINTFGVGVMAAFTVGVKIEAFAYMPLQEYGNGFSTFVSQNLGADNHKRIKEGVAVSIKLITFFGLFISVLVMVFAPQLMKIFVKGEEVEIIAIGTQYLRITGAFYVLIGFLFSFYGFFRGLVKVQVSILLTVISLGLRVLLAYSFAPLFGVVGIWWAIPIGWLLADLVGLWFLRKIDSLGEKKKR